MNPESYKAFVLPGKSLVLAFAVSMAPLGSAATATAEMKPGLWELGSRLTSDSGRIEQAVAQVEKSLTKLTPEQRRKLKESGIGLRNGATNMRICVTPELARVDTQDLGSLPADTSHCQLLSDELKPTSRTQVHLCKSPLLEVEQRWVKDPSTGQLLETSSVQLTEAEFDGVKDLVRVVSRWKFVSSSCGNTRPSQARREPQSAR